MSDRRSYIIMIGACLIIFAFILFWNTKPLIKEKEIVSATLVSDLYDELQTRSKDLTEEEIKTVVKIINSPRSPLKSYSILHEDCAFTFSATMKDSSTKNYDIFLKATGEVYIAESWTDFDPSDPFDRKSWKLDYGYNEEAFRSPVFQAFYPSYDPVFPIVYAEGTELLGDRSVDRWEYQDLFYEWRPSEAMQPSKQEQHYKLNGNVVNVLFPNFPVKASYALYDERSGSIQSGELTSPQIRLPDKKGDYILELSGSWDHLGSIAIEDGQNNGFTKKPEFPNSFRGSTTTRIHLTAGIDPSKIKKAEDISEYRELVDIKNILDRMDARYTLDRDRCEIKSFSKKDIAISIKKIKANDIQKTRSIDLTVEGQKVKRIVYEIGDRLYIGAETFAHDLGMLLKRNEKGAFYTENQLLYPVMEPLDHDHGYVDRKGQWVIPPILEDAQDFDGDHAVFSVNSTAIDEDRLRQSIQGAEFEQFSDDLQRALTDIYTPDIDGLLDKDGNVVIPPSSSFSYLGDNKVLIRNSDSSSEGSLFDYQYYLIDEQKKISVKIPRDGSASIEYIDDPSEGMIPISTSHARDGGWVTNYAYYDLLSGKKVIPYDYKYARSFSNGRAVVGEGGFHIDDHRFAVIDKKGGFKTPYIFDDIRDYSENVACVKISRNELEQYAYIDTEGNLLTGPVHKVAYPFQDGRAIVDLDDDHLVYIDKSFEIAKKPNGEPIGKIKRMENDDFDRSNEFDYREYGSFSFREGYAISLDNGRYGYIDRMGNVIIPHRFYAASPFKNGMARVSLDKDRYDEQETYIDPLGRIAEIPYWRRDR
ncbi:MAG: WG repeat-containing protein [Peptostreptococcaceae bacterium]|nr:WG repeat-containing protein [Peptostreptococcaceae bacterium]